MLLPQIPFITTDHKNKFLSDTLHREGATLLQLPSHTFIHYTMAFIQEHQSRLRNV